MNKILLSENDLQFVLNWRDGHKDLVRLGANPMKAVKIVCVDSKYTITGIRDGNSLELGINHNGSSLGRVTFEVMENGLCRLVKNRTKLTQENIQAALTVYCSVMALIVFGNETVDLPEPKPRKKHNADMPKPSTKSTPKKRRNKEVTYILTRGKGRPSIRPQGSHSSPRGQFSVRGHYRHYRSGKVVWVAEYRKGVGKEKKNTTYKVGKIDSKNS